MTPTSAPELETTAVALSIGRTDEWSEPRTPHEPVGTVVGIVLAGTYQSADSIFSGRVPRPLVPVAQIPVVAHVLRWLRDGAVTRATICSNSGSRAVSISLGDGASMSMQLDYIEDPTPRGPAGCARDAAIGSAAETFIVVDATVIPDLDLHALLLEHQRSRAAVTAVVHYASRGGRNDAHVATPTGIYIFSRRAFDAVSAFGFQDIKEHLLPALRRRQERVVAYSSPNFCPRVLNAETYLAVNHWMIERIPTNAADFERWGRFTVSGETMAHPSVHVHPTAQIIGPVVLGPGVTIAANAVIVGPTSLGDETKVAEGAIVSRSVVWHGSHIGERAFVDSSVVGHNITIAADVALHGEIRMQRAKSRSFHMRLMAEVPPLRSAPAGSVVDLALP